MKKLLILIYFLCYSISNFSQDFQKVDNIMRSYKEPKSIVSLSKRIDYDFKTIPEKVRAAFSWVAFNIRYRSHSGNLLKSPELNFYLDNYDMERRVRLSRERKAEIAFDKREGVCEGYSFLLSKIYDELGVENELIFGYTKSSANSIGKIPDNKNHVWNAVKVNNEWMILDVTYAAGFMYGNLWKRKFNPLYFNADKDFLNITHFPAKKNWREFLGQKELKPFCNAPLMKTAFLKNKVNVLEPKEGVVVAQRKKRILLKIEGLQEFDDVKYLYGNDGKVRLPRTITRDTVREFYLRTPKESTTLHIYIKNELALEYKVNLPN